MSKLLARIRVLLHAAPSYLTVAAVVVTIISQELGDALPGNASTIVAKAAGAVLAVIATATAIVRRVTPVLAEDRGLLVPPSKTDLPVP